MGIPVYFFGPFRFDPAQRRLFKGEQSIPIPGKAFETLRILLEHHGRLVTREELITALWPDCVVLENNLDHNVSVIRHALGQRRGDRTYIETVPRQGYRLVVPVEISRRAGCGPQLPAPGDLGPAAPSSEASLIERGAQRAQLRAALERALAGCRQTVFVKGESGIGKSALIRAFRQEVEATGAAVVAEGNCLRRHGQPEPYMPVFLAISRLARQGGSLCAEVIRRCAPSWAAQIPSIQTGPATPCVGVTSERMVRELTDALELLTQEMPVLWIVDDLHWADDSTLDLLARVGRSPESARLMILGAYRPSLTQGTPSIAALAQDLMLRDIAAEVALAPLTLHGLGEYLSTRFGFVLPEGAAGALYTQTGGNPLVVGAVVSSWIAAGALTRIGAHWRLHGDPELLSSAGNSGLQEIVQRELAELSPGERDVLDAASVAGERFCPSTVAAALDREPHGVEKELDDMARGGRFLLRAGPQEWPDGAICESYAFVHALYREFIYDRLPTGRRVHLHRRVAQRLELGYAGRVDEIVAELALHYSEARDGERGIRYLVRTAEISIGRGSHREAIGYLKSALELLGRLPELGERARREFEILSLLAPSLVATRGFADPEAERAFRRAYELFSRLERAPRDFAVVFGLAVMLEMRGQYSQAQRLIERHMPEQERSGELLLEARDLLACSRFHQGAFAEALRHGEEGARAFAPERHSEVSASLGEDPAIDCLAWMALSSWFLGFPDRALRLAKRVVSLASPPSRLYSLAHAELQLAFVRQLRQEERETAECATRAIEVAERHGYVYRASVGRVLLGWALARGGEHDRGIRKLQEGIHGCAAAGAGLDRPYHLGLLAEAHLNAGRSAEARAVLEEAMPDNPAKPFFYLSELRRLRAVAGRECREPSSETKALLLGAMETARSQGARSLELRAALSLLEQQTSTDGAGETREIVAAIAAQFTEGFETPDLRLAASALGRQFASRRLAGAGALQHRVRNASR